MPELAESSLITGFDMIRLALHGGKVGFRLEGSLLGGQDTSSPNPVEIIHAKLKRLPRPAFVVAGSSRNCKH